MNQPESVAVDAGPKPASTPRVWLVSGYRAGERNQIIALAEALGWPYQHKQLGYRSTEFLSSLFHSSGLRGIRLDESSPLQPPWPDLVISAGMRNEPVVRWIQAQSGRRARLVHIGRPWARLKNFDLLITTPQYRMPERSNILHNTTTLHRVTAARLAFEADAWRAGYARLPGPYLGVILGGHSGPYTFGENTSALMAQRINTLAAGMNASVLATSSARTPEKALHAFERHLSVPYDLYRWRANDTANPYFGILALSEALVVTADSISMLSEACATGKPLYMAELAGCGFPMRADSELAGDFRFSACTYSALMRFAHPRLSRDLRLVHRGLIDQGRAVWLGEAFDCPPPPPPDEIGRAVSRVKALFTK
jgi:mitochondrial fission protein ELM1